MTGAVSLYKHGSYKKCLKGFNVGFKAFGNTSCYYRFHSDSISVLLCVNFSFHFMANSEPLQWHRMTA